MILLGIRDLNGREILEVLRGSSEVTVDKKLKDEFGSADKHLAAPGKHHEVAHNLKLNGLEELPLFLQATAVRAVLLSLATFIMQNRVSFRCETLEILIQKLNAPPVAKNWTFEEFLGLVFGGQLDEKEKGLLVQSESAILARAELVLNYFLVRLFNDFHKLETCLFMEANKISFNFLTEIEKGNYEDRRLARVLNIYRNYFKKRTADKTDPKPELYNEVFLGLQLDGQIQGIEKMVTSFLSFEKKAYLQNKMVSESDFMMNYYKNIELGFGEIGNVAQKLADVKEARSPVNALRSQTVAKAQSWKGLFGIILNGFADDFNRAALLIKKQTEDNKKAVQANPKFKPKSSESWTLFESQINIGKVESNAETISETSHSLTAPQLESLLNGVNFDQVFSGLAEVFAPVLEQAKKPKIPKGTRDYTPLQMTIKSQAINKIRNIYKKHGAEEIDTPIFELKETLLGKYGEEGGKLIYDLEDQGGELLSLRYDLTVPFARFMGLNNLNKMKRFHIGKVYRRDQPNTNKGRFREFYQCDLDIAGKTDVMLAEAEILKIIVEILAGFDLKFKIKISHRLLLEAMIECAKCDSKKFKMICSSIDKLDKEPWEAVEKELIYEKGLTSEQTGLLKSFVLHKGKVADVLELIKTQNLFGDNSKAKTSMAEIEKLDNYLKIFKVYDNIDFDLSLARGLDYYTGLIFEAILVDGETGLGSIAGGGRYDELIGMFSKDSIPAVGGSIGIERLFVILEEKYKSQCRASSTEFLVGSIGKAGTLTRKMEIVNEFWDANLSTEFIHDEFPRPDKQLKFALEKRIPFIVWVGEDEVKNNIFKIKNLYLKKEVTVPGDELVKVARELSQTYKVDLEEGRVVFEE
jgi:histidyl-tRNA synthetase